MGGNTLPPHTAESCLPAQFHASISVKRFLTRLQVLWLVNLVPCTEIEIVSMGAVRQLLRISLKILQLLGNSRKLFWNFLQFP